MNTEVAEIIAYVSMFSGIIPMIVVLGYIYRYTDFFKYLIASIVITIAFDAFSVLNYQFEWNLYSIIGYFDIFAILSWGLAFSSLLKEENLLFKVNLIITSLSLVASIYLGVTNSGLLSMNFQNATLGSLYILAGSTLMIMYYLIIKQELVSIDRPAIIVLMANIVFYATATSIFIFFSAIAESQINNLYLIKWILYILLNCVFAFVLYSLRKGKWKISAV